MFGEYELRSETPPLTRRNQVCTPDGLVIDGVPSASDQDPVMGLKRLARAFVC